MRIFDNLKSYSSEKESILTIGTFDGVHIGHNKILKRLIQDSKKNNLSSLVMTFFPHPRMILNKSHEIKMIDTYHYAEDYHQQYLAKNPNGYCNLKGTGCFL